jgi:uncharacterized protein YdbL (DUF1318 family)
MKNIFLLIFILALTFGCARVKVEAPKEPIKVDISMRLDVYQHIEKDIDKIENIVSGSQEKPKVADKQSFLNNLIPSAYAQELSLEIEQAALRRRDRYSKLASLEAQGVLGENKSGLLEIRREAEDPSLGDLVSAENSDRMIIYESMAKKEGVSILEVQKLYAKRLQEQAPAGTPIEVLEVGSSGYMWKIK